MINKIKKWAKETALPWLKKSLLQIVNMLVLFVAYGSLDGGNEWLIGLWLFILLGYYIFWKLFGFDKVWLKIIEDRKNKR